MAQKSTSTRTPSKLDAQIRHLANLLDETGLSEISVKTDGQEITVKRALVVAANATGQLSAPANTTAEQAPAAEEQSPTEKYRDHPGAVTSPMVGTIYIAPEPGAAPFVQKGDKVKKGQTLFIVEAMKTMNNIVAPQDGRIGEILVSNEQPIEFGEVLAVIA